LSNQAFFDQIEQNINSLISEKHFKEAYSSCIKYINLYPGVAQLIDIKKRIEEEVAEENKKKVKEKIEEVRDAMKDKKYAESIKTLKDLLLISPNNSKIKDLILESQEGYKSQIDEQNKSFLKAKEKKLDNILETEPTSLIPELLIMEQNNAGNVLVQKLSLLYRDKLIAKKIKEQSVLLHSKKYNLVENFLNELEKINPQNEEVKKAKSEIRIGEHSEQTDEKEDFVYRSEKQLTTLVQLEKYDKAINVAQEILSIDSSNKRIKSLLEVIKGKYYEQSKNQVIEQIVGGQEMMLTSYKQDPSKFQKI